MIHYCLESGAFLKVFVAETGSGPMIALVSGTDDSLKSASSLTPLELRSAIRRRQYAGDIPQADADRTVSAISVESDRITLHPVTEPILELAAALADRRNIRALDSVQLATALTVSQSLDPADRLQFVVFDLRRLKAAEAEGLAVWDPATG